MLGAEEMESCFAAERLFVNIRHSPGGDFYAQCAAGKIHGPGAKLASQRLIGDETRQFGCQIAGIDRLEEQASFIVSNQLGSCLRTYEPTTAQPLAMASKLVFEKASRKMSMRRKYRRIAGIPGLTALAGTNMQSSSSPENTAVGF